MIFTETKLAGAYVVEPERASDDRGFFARTWCREEFQSHGLDPRLVQCNVSFNRLAGTLRGMHFQLAPHEEVKLVRCTRGAIHDVILDLRPESATFKKHFGVELTEDNGRMLFVPAGFAHGFYTLRDDSEVFYQMSETYHPESAAAVRWNDPEFGIRWPGEPRVISERDRDHADFTLDLLQAG
jgi:dTDP-4-dehydrorhamnose 3,5-epimerase